MPGSLEGREIGFPAGMFSGLRNDFHDLPSSGRYLPTLLFMMKDIYSKSLRMFNHFKGASPVLQGD